MSAQAKDQVWFSLKEAEQETGVDYETLRRLFIGGYIKGERKGLKKGQIFLPRDEVYRIKERYSIGA